MAASFVADLFTSPVTSTANNTTIAGATNVAVSAGDTAFFFFSIRGGSSTAQAVTISGLPGDAVIEGSGSGAIGTLQTSRTGSPANALIRVYFPTGMSSGTTITGTWVQSGSRKVMDAVVWTAVGNATAQATAVANNTGSTPTAGTTGATTTTTGVHLACWCWNSSVSTNSGVAGSDAGGTMTERTDKLVGASTFSYLYAEDRAETAAQAGGETATVTVTNALASWSGVQGVWDGPSGTAYTDSGTLTNTFALSGSDLLAHEYTDSGTLTATFALSGTDQIAHGYVDSGTLTVTSVLSGSDVAAFVDAATLTTAYTLSGSDLAAFTDAGTLPATFTLSGSDIYGHTDTGTLPVTFTLSGSDVAGFVDSSSLPATFTLSGSDIYTPASGGTAYTDSGTLTTTPTLSGSDVAAFTDAATLSTTFTLSGVNSHGYADAASLPVTFTLSGTQSFQAVDSGTLTTTPTLSGSDVYTSGSAQPPPITIRTYLVGASGRTRARSLTGASTLAGNMSKTMLTGLDGSTLATGATGRTQT